MSCGCLGELWVPGWVVVAWWLWVSCGCLGGLWVLGWVVGIWVSCGCLGELWVVVGVWGVACLPAGLLVGGWVGG